MGQTSTDFEVKQRNSARMLSSTAIDHLKNRQRGGLLRTVFVNSGGHETAMVPVQCTPIQHAKKGVRMVTCDPMPHLVRLPVVSVGQFIQMKQSVAEHRAQLDTVQMWLDDKAELVEGAWTPSATVVSSYTAWCAENNYEPKRGNALSILKA